MERLQFFAQNWPLLLRLTSEHLVLVVISTAIAALIGIPLGILLVRHPRWKDLALGIAGVLQTVPSLALFGLLIPLPLIGGIGARTATVALILYALLPIIRNTITGIEGVDRHVREAAIAMGMTPRQLLWQVELPLAMGVIMAGVRVAAVIGVGVATIAAAIGAGGLGTLIFRGLRANDDRLILAGAVPAAMMALAVDWALGRLESRLRARRPSRTFDLRAVGLAGSAALVLLLAIFSAWRFATAPTAGLTKPRLVVGSKDFTEQVILGEIIAQMLEARGVEVERRFELGGNLCHNALIAGQIDLYPEYTGTAYTAILGHPPLTDVRAVYEHVQREYLEKFDVIVGPPLGFRNDFAILVRGADARRLRLRTISDIAPYAPSWRAGFGQDFISRSDGYAGFVRAYNLRFAAPPREMDLALTYRALAAGEVDVIAGNSTDGLIAALDLVQLEDDRRYFPPYEAVMLVRRETATRIPEAREVLERLAGSISTAEMRQMNYEVDGERRSPAEVARAWRARKGF
ncbi:MAG: glycine/betaine ABC transporter substrate-binding protein [Pyrinomonas sp.]|uniref:glycine betaine ABC transporter substrate-binding protein n=1 Tax=Pyrinomonas sp. TaxID=2080306 RepID=UPI0033205086